MKVSIVTISFNRGRFLEQAIRSVVEQDHDDIEFIVVDAGSTDGSREIIERYRDRIATIVFEPDDGPPDGLNKGFALATGDVCATIDADDGLLPGALRRVVAAFRDRPHVDVLCGHGYLIDGEGRVLQTCRQNRFDGRRFVYGGCTYLQQATFARRQAFLDVGGFNTQNFTCWDGEHHLAMWLAGKTFDVLDEYLAVWRRHEAAITMAPDFQQRLRKDEQRLFEMVMHRPPNRWDDVMRPWIRFEKWCRDPAHFLRRTLELVDPPRQRVEL